VSGWFAKAVAESGIPRATPHDLRHTAASLAVSAGANVKAVQKMLGHASAAMTLDVYADLFDDDLEAVAGALNDARLRENAAKLGPRCGHGAPNGPTDGLLNTATMTGDYASELRTQKSQSSSSVTTALPITYDEPEPEKKSWFSSGVWSKGRKRLYLRKDIRVIHTQAHSSVGKCGQNVGTAATPPGLVSRRLLPAGTRNYSKLNVIGVPARTPIGRSPSTKPASLRRHRSRPPTRPSRWPATTRSRCHDLETPGGDVGPSSFGVAGRLLPGRCGPSGLSAPIPAVDHRVNLRDRTWTAAGWPAASNTASNCTAPLTSTGL